MKFRGLNTEFVASLGVSIMVALVIAIAAAIIIATLKKRGANINLPVSYPLFIITICYLFSVASVTIVPVAYTEKFQTANINLVPLVNTYKNLIEKGKTGNWLFAPDVGYNIFGNILMFAPFGILLPSINKRFASYKKIFVLAAGSSILIEIIQLLSRFINNYRQVDIDDVILNTLGALLGFYCYKKWVKQTNVEAPQKEFI